MRKNRRKNLMLTGLISLATGLLLTACGSSEDAAGEENLKVGVLQFMEHESLSLAREGFLSELEEAGYTEGENMTLDYQNAQGNQANLQSMSEQLAGENDVILSIATPAAQAMANATSEDPILFTAITDPLGAGLVDSMEAPGRNLTGTQAMAPVADQVELLFSLAPEAETIGIIYNSSEINSQVLANLAQEEIEAAGKSVEVMTVTSTNDVQQVMTALAQKVDAVYVPTDNTLASTMATVGEIAKEYDLPIVPGDAQQVLAGGLATYGFNYEDLGRQTARMALRIIEEGANPAEMPVETSDELNLTINEEMAEALGIEPESISAPE